MNLKPKRINFTPSPLPSRHPVKQITREKNAGVGFQMISNFAAPSHFSTWKLIDFICISALNRLFSFNYFSSCRLFSFSRKSFSSNANQFLFSTFFSFLALEKLFLRTFNINRQQIFDVRRMKREEKILSESTSNFFSGYFKISVWDRKFSSSVGSGFSAILARGYAFNTFKVLDCCKVRFVNRKEKNSSNGKFAEN